jgi:hypothetical protein
MVAPNNIASPGNSHDSATRAALGVPPVPGSNAQRSEPELVRDAAARNNAPSHPAAPSDITPRERWAHLLVLDMINANLPLPRLADHLKIPFDTLIAHINTPEVQAEINAYEALINLRARLIGEAARPISLRRLLDVLESPAPSLSGRDPDADTRALHRHAELIRRTATTIARESRALAPTPPRAPKSSPRTASVIKQTLGPSNSEPSNAEPSNAAPSGATSSRRVPKDEPELVRDGSTPSPSAPDQSERRVACLGEDQACSNARRTSVDSSVDSHGCGDAAVPPAPSDNPPSNTPGRTEAPARQSPTDALRAAAGSTRALRDPSRRARDHPTRPAA